MNNSVISSTRKKLEEVWNQESQPQVKNLRLLSGLNTILQRLMKVFLGGNELRVWQTDDRYGNNWWHAYDPLTDRYTCVESEEEMLAWIEKCYYR